MTLQNISLSDYNLIPIELFSREKELSKVKRFHQNDMIYAQNLNHHYFSCSSIIHKFKTKLNFLNINWEEALNISEVHDDIEIITSDIPSNLKLELSSEKQILLSNIEKEAAKYLYYNFNKEKINSNYLNLLIKSNKKTCIESQIVSYADKIVGFSEMIHETLAGNLDLYKNNVHNNYKKIFELLPNKLNHLDNFFESLNKLNFTRKERIDETIKNLEKIIKDKKFINFQIYNFEKPTGIEIYDFYTKSIINNNFEIAYKILTEKREHKSSNQSNKIIQILN